MKVRPHKQEAKNPPAMVKSSFVLHAYIVNPTNIPSVIPSAIITI